MIHPRTPITPIALFVMMLASGAPLAANMAAPLQPGTALGEPRAALAGLSIERERLQIDLRPLALEPADEAVVNDRFGHALISATYWIRNDAAERPLTLEFVAQALDTSQWSVLIDGRRARATYRPVDEATVGWRLPASTPGLDGAPLRYEAEATGILRFDLLLTPGRHSIRVEYVANATRQVTEHPLVNWQLGYILEPARRWPSFGALEVSVLMPSGWSVATEPSLKRSGDILTGRFEGVPADALTISARGVYEPWYPLVAWLPALIAFALGTIAAYRLGRSLGRRLARNDKGAAWALPAAVGAAFVLSVAVSAAGLAGASIEEGFVGVGQGAWGGYSFLFVELLIGALSFIAGLALVQTGAVRAINRARRRYDARWIDAYPDEESLSGTLHTNGSYSREI